VSILFNNFCYFALLIENVAFFWLNNKISILFGSNKWEIRVKETEKSLEFHLYKSKANPRWRPCYENLGPSAVK
jgi:hypothetical protein